MHKVCPIGKVESWKLKIEKRTIGTCGTGKISRRERREEKNAEDAKNFIHIYKEWKIFKTFFNSRKHLGTGCVNPFVADVARLEPGMGRSKKIWKFENELMKKETCETEGTKKL